MLSLFTLQITQSGEHNQFLFIFLSSPQQPCCELGWERLNGPKSPSWHFFLNPTHMLIVGKSYLLIRFQFHFSSRDFLSFYLHELLWLLSRMVEYKECKYCTLHQENPIPWNSKLGSYRMKKMPQVYSVHNQEME